MRIACWIPKATNAYSKYIMRIYFPLQQWLHERASVLRYTYIACIVFIYSLRFAECQSELPGAFLLYFLPTPCLSSLDISVWRVWLRNDLLPGKKQNCLWMRSGKNLLPSNLRHGIPGYHKIRFERRWASAWNEAKMVARGREFRMGAYFSVRSWRLGTDGEEIGLIVVTVSGDMTNSEFTLCTNSCR